MFKLNAKLVRAEILRRGLSLKEFAAQSGLNGLTAAKVIRDDTTASLKTISALAKFFNVDGESLILKS